MAPGNQRATRRGRQMMPTGMVSLLGLMVGASSEGCVSVTGSVRLEVDGREVPTVEVDCSEFMFLQSTHALIFNPTW